MAKSFDILRRKLSRVSRARGEAKAHKILAELALQELRQSLKVTQEEIARALNMKQAAISRLENQDDMYLSTLNRLVMAMGGTLKLVATFRDREVILSRRGG